MVFRYFKFKHLKDHTMNNHRYNNNYNDPFHTFTSSSNRSTFAMKDKICPVYLLPLLITFIFAFTIAQIVMIHRTIEAYKLRDQAYRDCYYPNENGGKKNKTATTANVATKNNTNNTTSIIQSQQPTQVPPISVPVPSNYNSNSFSHLESSSASLRSFRSGMSSRNYIVDNSKSIKAMNNSNSAKSKVITRFLRIKQLQLPPILTVRPVSS